MVGEDEMELYEDLYSSFDEEALLAEVAPELVKGMSKQQQVISRGSNIISDSKFENFLLLWGCSPKDGVAAKTKMVQDIVKSFETNLNHDNLSV